MIQKNVKEGQSVQEGMTLYEVADLSHSAVLRDGPLHIRLARVRRSHGPELENLKLAPVDGYGAVQ